MTNTTQAAEFAADLSPVMRALEAAYRMIQARYDDAPDVTIVIKRDSRAWGHTTVAQVWGDAKATQAHRYEVMISGENLRRGARDVAATLIHEAAHARNLNKGTRDTDVNGRHNTKFRDAAAEMGLTVTEAGWHGYAMTSLEDDGAKSWAALIKRIETGIARAVVAHALPTVTLPPVTGKASGGESDGGEAIAPPKRGGRRNLRKCECACGFSVRMSQTVLDAAAPTCQKCGSEFLPVD